jgi:hypothetical protein
MTDLTSLYTFRCSNAPSGGIPIPFETRSGVVRQLLAWKRQGIEVREMAAEHKINGEWHYDADAFVKMEASKPVAKVEKPKVVTLTSSIKDLNAATRLALSAIANNDMGQEHIDTIRQTYSVFEMMLQSREVNV